MSLYANAQTASLTITPANCPNQGSITVNASGGTPYPAPLPANYNYQITAPAAYATSIQSSNVFNSLGGNITYTIQVYNQAGSIIVTGFVPNNYTLMTVSATALQPVCVTGSDGKITVSVSGGKAPFSYSLSGPSTAGPQASPIFNGLVQGSYIVSVTDACGEVRTHAVSVPIPIDFTFSNLSVVSDDFAGPFSIIPSAIPGDCNRVRGKLLSFIGQAIPGGVIINRTLKVFDHLTNTLIYTNTVPGNLDNNFVIFQKNKQYRLEAYDNCNILLSEMIFK